MGKLRNFIVRGMMRTISGLPLKARESLRYSLIGEPLRRLLSVVEGEEGPRVFEIMAGPRKGLKMISDLRQFHAHYLGMYEPEIGSAIAQHLGPGMVAFDVGSHIGYMSLLMARRVTESGKVYAFEPLPANLKLLEKTMQINHFNHVTVVPVAVSSHRAERNLVFGKDSSKGRVVGLNFLNDRSRAVIQVRTMSLDDFIIDKQLTHVELVKIDIEGHEVEALYGSQHLLSDFKPTIVCEFHSADLYSEGIAFLRSLRYHINNVSVYRVPHVIATPT